LLGGSRGKKLSAVAKARIPTDAKRRTVVVVVIRLHPKRPKQSRATALRVSASIFPSFGYAIAPGPLPSRLTLTAKIDIENESHLQKKPLHYNSRLRRTVHLKILLTTISLATATIATPALCDGGAIDLRFENHRFTPQTLTVPANAALVLKVANTSNETIEFESFKLNREKAVEPGQTITVRLPPLSPGSYDFYDDFHQDVPEGSIVAK
jgi:hypothetical protein